jgi:hypothetical protein
MLEQWVINTEFADGELVLPNMSADASLRAQRSIMSANASLRAHHSNCIKWHRCLPPLWGETKATSLSEKPRRGKYWSTGVLKYWSIGVMEYWSVEKVTGMSG